MSSTFDEMFCNDSSWPFENETSKIGKETFMQFAQIETE